MSTCKTATPPRRPAEVENSKINTMFLTTSSRKPTKIFFEILPVLRENQFWMWTQVVKNGQNRYFFGKLNNFFLRQARELIFSLKYLTLNVLTGKNWTCPRKNLCVKKKDLKLTKCCFFSDMEFWLLSENRNLLPWIMKINITKYTLPKTTLKIACNKVLNFFLERVWKRNWLLSFRQKINLFLDTFFVWILWWEWLGKII